MSARAMVKGLVTLATTGTVLLIAAACGSGSGADSDTVTLRFSYFTSENNPIGKTWKAWMEEVTERSNGTIEFEEYWDGTLLPADAVVEGLTDGRADIAQVTPTFYPGKFPLTAVNELPFGSDNVGAISAAMSTLAQDNEDLAEEWSSKGLRPLAWNVGGPSSIASTTEIESAADFKGLKLRGIDRGTEALKGAGANIMALGPDELYSAMDRGLLDAVYGIQFGVIPSLKLQEVSDYVVDASTGASTASALAMSEERWGELSEEHQKILEEVSSTVPQLYVDQNLETEAASCKATTEAGVELSVLPPAEVDKLRAAGEKLVVDEWLAEVNEAGHEGAEFRKEYDAAVKEASAKYPDAELSGVERCLEQG